MVMVLAAMEMAMDTVMAMDMVTAANMVAAITSKIEKVSCHHSKKYSAGKGM